MITWNKRFCGGITWVAIGLSGCGGSAFTSESPDGGLGDSTDGSLYLDVGRPDTGENRADANDNTQDAVASDGAGPDADASAAHDGGTASEGGGASDADTSCVASMITFVMKGASGSSTKYCAGGSGTCSADWLTLRPTGKTAIAITAPCESTCGACTPIACPAVCAAPSSLPPAGIKQTWDGTEFARSTCGAGLACVTPTCAERGSYIARMCAYANDSVVGAVSACNLGGALTCVEVPFDWPPVNGAAVVTGTLDGQGCDSSVMGGCTDGG